MLHNFRIFIPLLIFVVFNFGDAFALTPPKEPLPCLNKTFTIIAHIVNDSAGVPNITQGAITAAIATVNQYFEPICVTFVICEFRYIDNFQYDTLHQDLEYPEVLVKYHQENRINMFFVAETNIGASFASLAGIANLTSGGIVIMKPHGGLVYTHEMGHYFGLSHTHEGAGLPGSELVDGSNSATAGDLITDTPADPYTGLPMPSYLDGCRFINMQQDANGDYYDPHVGNIMSYYDSACKCEFTYEQYKKMANTYLSSNPKMW